MFNKEKRLIFSIRKFSVGVASALIGMSWMSSNQPAIAAQQNTTKSIRYHYVLESELKAEEKARIVTQLPSHQVNQMDTYYMVYRPMNQLPNTGNQMDTTTVVVGSSLLLIGVALTKGRKRKYIASLVILAASGQTLHVSAIEAYQLAGYNQTYQLAVGDPLPDGAISIANHQFVGYIIEDQLPDLLDQTAITTLTRQAELTDKTALTTVPSSPIGTPADPTSELNTPATPPAPIVPVTPTPTDQVRYETELEEIVFSNRTVSDDSLPAGTTLLVSQGQNGRLEHTVKITEKADGTVTREIVATKELNPVVHQVTAVGTKPALPQQPVVTSEDVAIAYTVEYVEDDTRMIGEETIIQYGQNGLKRITYTDGVLSAETIITEPVKQIISRGSKVEEPPTVTETTESIPFDTEIVEDANLAKGEEVIDQVGQNGVKTNKLVNGMIVSSTVTTEPVKQIIRRGTYVAPIVDKITLQNQVDMALAQVESNFTPESYAVLANAKEQALAILANPSATQDEVNAQVAQLEDALAKLVAKEPDVVTFKEERIPFETQTVEDPELPLGLENVVQDGHDGLIGITYTNGIETKRTIIRESQPKIIHVGKKAVVDTQPLIEDIAASQQLQEMMYSPRSWAEYTQALKHAESILQKENVTQAEVDQARAQLDRAKQALAVDKTQLTDAVQTASALQQADYSPASWQALTTALQQAETTLQTNDASQAAINQAYETLQRAKDGLAVDKTQLTDAVQTASTLQQADYSPASWQPFNTALTQAQTVLNNQTAKQHEVDQALTQLTQAKQALTVDRQA